MVEETIHFYRGLNPTRIQGTHLNNNVRGKKTIEIEIGLTEIVKWTDATKAEKGIELTQKRYALEVTETIIILVIDDRHIITATVKEAVVTRSEQASGMCGAGITMDKRITLF